jgi:alanine-glyoxylate transaminase / serine-glyoxylate transaminase / serine-pyruvate transaminase
MSVFTPPRRLLFGPGPTAVEPRVYQAMAQPVVGHLDPALFEIHEEVRKGLRQAFGTANPLTFLIPGTGGAGMETAVSNFVDPGSKFVVLVNGIFGERIADQGRRHGATVVRCEKPWGEIFSEAEVRAVLERERPAVVAFVHGETSTGALQPPEAVTRPARDLGVLVIADCVTSLGAVPIGIDKTGIDVAYSCSQKGMSCPPGVAPFTASPRALERLEARKFDNPVWYLDLKLLMGYYDHRRYHHTAPVSLHYAIREGLAAMLEEGLEARFARHERSHQSFVRRLKAMGLEMFVPEGRRLINLNTVRVPEGVDDVKVRKELLQQHGIEIGAGLGQLAGKVFRVGLMGPLANEKSLDMFFDAFAQCLAVGSPV